MIAPKRILVPTDFSEFSDDALEVAYDIAKQYQAKIYLLHVIETIQQCAVDYCLEEQTVDELEKQILASSEKMMKEQIEKVVKSKDVEIITDIRKGTAHREILKEEQSRNIDLVVISSHGKTGFLGHLLGSVAEKITREAKCPVVLVRKK
ncbi:MAG: UspA protein [Deltaproteobacteria bacterium]|nr:UspA protein [Deltaproteobacteria bacterium]